MVNFNNFNGGDPLSKDDANGVPDIVKQFFQELKKSSSAKQLTVGAIGGWAAGYVAAKFGKVAAMGIGGSLLLLQIAKYNGYIDVDWKRFNQDVQAAKMRYDKSKSTFPVIIENVHEFASQNVVLAGGFASGFLLGFAFA